MEFLKTLAKEAEKMQEYITPQSSVTDLQSPYPPLCGLSTPLMSLHMSVVMETMVDELEVLSSTFGELGKRDLRSGESKMLDAQEHKPKFTHHLHKKTMTLEQRYTSVLPRRMMQTLNSPTLWSPRRQSLGSTKKGKHDSGERKNQRDLLFMQMFADNMVKEMLQKGTYTSLCQLVLEERDHIRETWAICNRLKYGNIKMAKLKNEIARVRHEKLEKVAELDADISRLIDTGLELDKRMGLEQRLVEKQVNMQVKLVKRRHRQMLTSFQDQIAKWKKKLSVEFKVHEDMVEYITMICKRRNELLNYWMEKYEDDLAALDKSLEEIKTERLRDTLRAQYLNKMITRREPIIQDYRRVEAIKAARLRQIAHEHKCSIKISAWWRGTMVRNQLGPFRPVLNREKKEKKGKKGEKGKSKK